MDIEIIKEIITMVGAATDTAAYVAIAWIIGGYLLSLIYLLVISAMVIKITSKLLAFYACPVSKENYTKMVDNSLLDKEKIRSLQADAAILARDYESKLMDVKNMYRILKESKE